MRTVLLVVLAGSLSFAVIGATSPAYAQSRTAKRAPSKMRSARLVAGTDGRYFVKNKHFGGWSAVDIKGGPGREKITHIYMPSSVTTLGIHKEPIPSPIKRFFRRISGKAPPLDGKVLPVELE